MKKLISKLISVISLICLISGSDIVGQITSFPYVEDFESGANGWYVVDSANSSWELGTPKGGFITPNIPGSKSWVTNLSGNYNDTSLSYVTSPTFDFSGLSTDPTLRFSQIFNIPFNDIAYVQYSIDGGVGWVKLGAFGEGTNWYNMNVVNYWEALTYPAGEWRFAEHSLCCPGLAGQSNVKLRFAFESNFVVTKEGWGIDNILVYEQLRDAAMISIDSIVSACSLTSSESITIQIQNTGTDTITSLNVFYKIDNLPPANESISATLLPAQIYNHTFTIPANLAAVKEYKIKAYVSLAGDQYAFNDTLYKTINNVPVINNYPYLEDFESGQAGWTSEGTNSSWAYGRPLGNFISNAASGLNAWVTNLQGVYNSDEWSYLISPCFDLSSFTVDPTLRLSLIYSTESCCDYGWVEYSTDGGSSWSYPTVLGAFGSGINWYNEQSPGLPIPPNPPDHWVDKSGSWRIAQHLTGLQGQSNVRFKMVFFSDGSNDLEGFGVDNVMLFDTLTDALILAIDTPVHDCNLSANQAIRVLIQNLSTQPISNFQVAYRINGGIPVEENILSTLQPGDTLIYTFTTLADFGSVAEYQIACYTKLSGDQFTANDTAFLIVNHLPTVIGYSYLEDFESGKGGWHKGSIGSSPSSWGFGTPAKTFIQGAFSGSNSWVTGGTGTQPYFDSENSYIQSPCLDFTTLTDPYVGMEIWWDSENGLDGTALQFSTDSGTNWITVGAMGDPNNWYNKDIGTWGPGWSGDNFNGGSSNGWLTAIHELNSYSLAGEPNVAFRIIFHSDVTSGFDGFAFDDFEIGEPPRVDLGPDTGACEISLDIAAANAIDVNSKFSYLWNTGDTTRVIILINYDTIIRIDTLIVRVTNTFGVGYDTIIVILFPTPQPYLGNDTAFCTGDSLILDPGISGANYQWSTADTTQTITVDSSGGYDVIVTTINGCSNADTITVVVYADTPIVNFGYSSDSGLTVYFSDSTINGFYYWWDFGDGDTSTQQNPTHIYGAFGNYLVTLIASNGCGADTIWDSIGVWAIGINEVPLEDEAIIIYPNPNDGSFNISINGLKGGQLTLYIINGLGQVVLTQRVITRRVKSLEMNLNKLSAGFYFVRIVTEKNVYVRKVLIMDN